MTAKSIGLLDYGSMRPRSRLSRAWPTSVTRRQLQQIIPPSTTAMASLHLKSRLPFFLPGIISDQLNSLLQLLLPSAKSSTGKILLGVTERTLASSIAQQLGINCDTGERTLEMIRGIRLHAEHLLAKAGTGMTSGDVKAAQLGLGHSYSRSKVKVSWQ
jgi:hypothetical protein